MTGNHLAEKLHLGLVGAGPWGRNYINTIRTLDGVTLTRLASRNPESLTLVEPGCEISSDWTDLIGAGDLDGIIVAAPPARHAEITLAAIDGGLPVLVEKPMAMALADAEAVVEQAQARGAVVLVDHIHLYSAAWEALKREARTLGPVLGITCEYGQWGPFRHDTPMLWDWGPHGLSMCFDLVGRPPDRAAVRRLPAPPVDDGEGEIMALELNFGGVSASVTIGNMFEEKKRLFTATFEKGDLVYDDSAAGGLFLDSSVDAASEAVPLAAGRPLERAVRAFADAINRGAPDFEDAVLGMKVVQVLTRLQDDLGVA